MKKYGALNFENIELQRIKMNKLKLFDSDNKKFISLLPMIYQRRN
jgi:hypothetical protein